MSSIEGITREVNYGWSGEFSAISESRGLIPGYWHSETCGGEAKSIFNADNAKYVVSEFRNEATTDGRLKILEKLGRYHSNLEGRCYAFSTTAIEILYEGLTAEIPTPIPGIEGFEDDLILALGISNFLYDTGGSLSIFDPSMVVVDGDVVMASFEHYCTEADVDINNPMTVYHIDADWVYFTEPIICNLSGDDTDDNSVTMRIGTFQSHERCPTFAEGCRTMMLERLGNYSGI